MQRSELEQWFEQTLEPKRFTDYCPNGLQVEGRSEIHRLVTGVTASLALIDKAIEVNADGVLVHHGWFWRGEDLTVRGIRKQRLAKTLAHDL
ncbi:MAG TPA: Nif3-like dinuclear metal center hexameric protein, partial [Orrella sp.]